MKSQVDPEYRISVFYGRKKSHIFWTTWAWVNDFHCPFKICSIVNCGQPFGTTFIAMQWEFDLGCLEKDFWTFLGGLVLIIWRKSALKPTCVSFCGYIDNTRSRETATGPARLKRQWLSLSNPQMEILPSLNLRITEWMVFVCEDDQKEGSVERDFIINGEK